MPLPAGIGDEGFSFSARSHLDATLYVRVGDTILQLLLNGYGSEASPSAPTRADKDWLVNAARQAAARYAAQSSRG